MTIYINKVLRIYYIEPENRAALTKSGRKKYAGGISYLYLNWINQFEDYLEGRFIFKLKNNFAYAYYSILKNRNLITILKPVNKLQNKFKVFFLYPFAWILSKIFGWLKKN